MEIIYRTNKGEFNTSNPKDIPWDELHCLNNDIPSLEIYNNSRIGYDVKMFHKNGELHRENDLPAYETSTGEKQWYEDGKEHRLNGPSRIGKNKRIRFTLRGKHHKLKNWVNYHPNKELAKQIFEKYRDN